MLKKIVFFVVLVFAPVFIQAQTKSPKPPSRKEQEKKAAKMEQDGLKADKKAKKEFSKRQSKETRRRSKENRKKSSRIRKSKGAPFWERWFRKR
jgi:hypothetical protein